MGDRTRGQGTKVAHGLRGRSRLIVAASVLVAGAMSGLFAMGTSSAVSAPRHSGNVDVLYAGSFLDLMQNDIGPAFHKATGYTVVGVSNGSTALANEIKGGIEVGDVFISASPSADASLEGTANGNWVKSYLTFGTSQLVLGYNPKSSFVKDLKTKPWYTVVDHAGFRLGRTDPTTDPKGVLAVDALEGVGLAYDLPPLYALASSTSNIYAETSMIGELQAGELDAGFFYAVEAAAAKIKTVPLTSTNLAAQYTVAQLKGAPHSAAAKAFITFLLSKQCRAILKANGVTSLVPPVLSTAG